MRLLRITGFGQGTQMRAALACPDYAAGRFIRFDNSRLLTDDAQWHDDCASRRNRDTGALTPPQVKVVHDAPNRL